MKNNGIRLNSSMEVVAPVHKMGVVEAAVFLEAGKEVVAAVHGTQELIRQRHGLVAMIRTAKLLSQCLKNNQSRNELIHYEFIVSRGRFCNYGSLIMSLVTRSHQADDRMF